MDGWIFANRDSKNCQITGLNDKAQATENTSIVPNPAKNNFTFIVEWNQIEGGKQVEIYNLNGSLERSILINQARTEITTSGLSNGMYFLKFGTQIEKLLINK